MAVVRPIMPRRRRPRPRRATRQDGIRDGHRGGSRVRAGPGQGLPGRARPVAAQPGPAAGPVAPPNGGGHGPGRGRPGARGRQRAGVLQPAHRRGRAGRTPRPRRSPDRHVAGGPAPPRPLRQRLVRPVRRRRAGDRHGPVRRGAAGDRAGRGPRPRPLPGRDPARAAARRPAHGRRDAPRQRLPRAAHPAGPRRTARVLVPRAAWRRLAVRGRGSDPRPEAPTGAVRRWLDDPSATGPSGRMERCRNCRWGPQWATRDQGSRRLA